MRSGRLWRWAALAGLLALGLARLRFNVEVLDLLPEQLPVVQGLKQYNRHFANARQLLVAIEGHDAEAVEYAARTLAEALDRATNLVAAATWRTPWSERPVDAAEFFAYLWFNQPAATFGALTNRLSGDGLAAALAGARERLATSLSPEELGRLSYDPLDLTGPWKHWSEKAPTPFPEQDRFASPDGRYRVVLVQARNELANYRECVRWLEAIQTLVESTRRAHGFPESLVISYTGRPAFVAEISRGMERDITVSVAGTAGLIAVLFWVAHRRFQPLLWLLALLVLALAITLAIGALLFGTLSVISVGFAAILLGLAVDYGLVLYQEARHAPASSAEQVRRKVAPSIIYAALTTGGAFAMLNWSGLPGLAQLGSLVAIGVAVAATLMLRFYLPPLRRGEQGHASGGAPGRTPILAEPIAQPASGLARSTSAPVPPRSPMAGIVTASLALGAGWTLASGLPRLDHTPDALRPRDSAAFATLQLVKHRIGPAQEPFWLLVSGRTEADVAQRLAAVEPALARAQAAGQVASFALPTWLWPRLENQAKNRATARALSDAAGILRRQAETEGFTPEALALTEAMLAAWQRAAASTNAFWPTNGLSQWILGQFVARAPERWFALGLLYPATHSPAHLALTRLSALRSTLPPDGVWLTGWELLGETVLSVVKQDLWRVLAPMAGLICFVLGLAFRRWTEVALSLATLALSALLLLAIMRLAGWSWNLMNLMALPLLLGMGVDYSIHMQCALRRHGGDMRAARRVTGRALLLCGATTIAGFGSLIWASNVGLASLGRVCATGIACAMAVAVGLLPEWWCALQRFHRVQPGGALKREVG